MIKTDKEFHKLIPALTEEEHFQLEQNLISEGCRDPIVIWGDIVIDGHNRLEICLKHNIHFETVHRNFVSREDAADWIDANQLGRRNLKPDQMSVIRGRRYNRQKKANGQRGPEKLDQNEPAFNSTADRLAKEHGVSPATIKRDGKKAELLDALPQQTISEVIDGKKKLKDVLPERMPSNTRKETPVHPCIGLHLADVAIRKLSEIDDDDLERAEALNKVLTYCKRGLTCIKQ